jgi:MYXO-CTERM domain-containing protein
MSGTPELECLSARADGVLFGCGQNWVDNKAIAQLQTNGAWSDVFQFVQLAGPLACPAGTPEHDQCGPQWPSLQMQFQSTGPTCGSNQGSGGGDAGVPPPPPHTGGCATASTGPASLAGLLAVCGLVLTRRRRQRRQ